MDGVVDLLGIGHLLDRRPAALSGGEKQRVAIGRALVASPQAHPDGRAAGFARRGAQGGNHALYRAAARRDEDPHRLCQPFGRRKLPAGDRSGGAGQWQGCRRRADCRGGLRTSNFCRKRRGARPARCWTWWSSITTLPSTSACFAPPPATCAYLGSARAGSGGQAAHPRPRHHAGSRYLPAGSAASTCSRARSRPLDRPTAPILTSPSTATASRWRPASRAFRRRRSESVTAGRCSPS